MAHDHHFLSRLDRASGDHVDLALGLYRDHEAVRYILDRLKLRPGQERVALALGRLDRGPYVVLQSNGRFVTCLGEGMSTGALDIVPRERVDELLAKHRESKGRESALDQEQRKDENRREFFGRLFRRANMLSREEFQALASFAPIMGATFYWMSVDASKYVVENCAHFYGVQKVAPKDRDLARSIYEAVWNTGHFIMLAGLEREELEKMRDLPGRMNIATHLATYGNATSMLKAVWAGSQLGKLGFDRYESSLDPERPQTNVLEAVLALVVIALRDKTLVPGVTRALGKLDEAYGPVEQGPDGEALNLAAAGLKILHDPDEYLTNAVLMGKGLFHLFGKDLPQGDRARYDDLTAVPEDLAATTLLSLEAPLYEPNTLSLVMSAAPLVAMAKAEDFYFTREVGRAVLKDWEPEQTLRTIGRFAVDMSQKPRRVEPKVGRNDPCPCGSGKKYKKCHGAN